MDRTWRMIRALEPRLMRTRDICMNRWTSKFVGSGDDLRGTILPWGFLPQDTVKGTVGALRSSQPPGKGVSGFDEEAFLDGVKVAYRQVGKVFTSPDIHFDSCEMTSPTLTRFLDDVRGTYKQRKLSPKLCIKSVEARLCNVGVRLGGIRRNRNFMGMMNLEEIKYNIMMGLAGPEAGVVNELKGDAPSRLIADVELQVMEEFVLEDESGSKIFDPVFGSSSSKPSIHYWTFQRDYTEGDESGESTEWQLCNVNDIVLPTFSHYFVSSCILHT
ncbi:unnamed protein product [Chrysoparadoxa australica]